MRCSQHQNQIDTRLAVGKVNVASRCLPPGCRWPPLCRPPTIFGTSTLQPRKTCILSAIATGPEEGSDSFEDLERTRQQLSRVYETPSISGQELRHLIVEKWGRSYDTRLHKRGRRMYLQIMWKYLEQRSFHMSENEYQAQLDAVAEYLTLWRVAPTVRAAIRSAPPRGPGYTGGGGARAVSIPLDVEVDGGRNGEWDSF